MEVPDSGLEPGILPTEIRKLVESRRQVKQLMKGDITTDQYTQVKKNEMRFELKLLISNVKLVFHYKCIFSSDQIVIFLLDLRIRKYILVYTHLFYCH